MIRTILVLAGILAIPAGIVLSRPIKASSGPRAQVRSGTAPGFPTESLDSLADALVQHDPFRAERRPAAVAYGAVPVPQEVAVAPPKPELLLTGILWGTTPIAVIEGFPGIDGARVLRPGDVVSGIRLQRVTEKQAVLAGLDTTWTLTVRKSW